MLPFLSFDPAVIMAALDAVSRCDDFGSFVPYGLLQSDNVTTPCSIGSQQCVNVTDTTNAFNHY